MLATVGDLISFSLRAAGILGVGQSARAEDALDALVVVNNIRGQWQRKRWLVWSLTDTSLVSTGAAIYTVVPDGDFSVARPDRIESAFARFLDISSATPLDYPLAVIQSREDWNTISLKSLGSLPLGLWYDNAFPIGYLHPWPVPPAGLYELHISTKTTLPLYTALSSPLNLPPEYLEALVHSVSVRLAMNYGMEPRPSQVSAMRSALAVLRMANVQIPELQMPAGLGSQRSGGVAAGSSTAFQTGSW